MTPPKDINTPVLRVLQQVAKEAGAPDADVRLVAVRHQGAFHLLIEAEHDGELTLHWKAGSELAEPFLQVAVAALRQHTAPTLKQLLCAREQEGTKH